MAQMEAERLDLFSRLIETPELLGTRQHVAVVSRPCTPGTGGPRQRGQRNLGEPDGRPGLLPGERWQRAVQGEEPGRSEGVP